MRAIPPHGENRTSRPGRYTQPFLPPAPEGFKRAALLWKSFQLHFWGSELGPGEPVPASTCPPADKVQREPRPWPAKRSASPSCPPTTCKGELLLPAILNQICITVPQRGASEQSADLRANPGSSLLTDTRDFPGDPVVKTPSIQYRGHWFDPRSHILHTTAE